MNILQILPELQVGGVETGTVDFAKYLLEKGHRPVVVSNGGALVEDLERAGVKHYILPVHRKNIWTAWRCIKELTDIIRNEKIDIVHARSRVPAWIAFFSCRKTNAAFITTCHGYYGKHFFSRVMGWSKLVIVPSRIIGRHMIDDFHVPGDRIRLIPRSVDLDKFPVHRAEQQGKSRYTIAMVGRITPLKGHTCFLKAMAQVVRSMPFVKIWIIGDAPPKKQSYKEELEHLTQRLGLGEHVEFLGNRKDVPELLAQADILVLSTVTQEAFGRVILEAQAAGVPVVATRIGGVVDIIDDGKTGLLVTPKDSDAMAQAVKRLLKDRVLASRLVAEAIKKLRQNFTLQHMADATITVYEELLRLTNILVIKISSIGDVILVTAALKALRKKFPQARIVCLTGKESRKVLQGCPYIDELVVYDLKGKDKGLWGLFRIGHKLRHFGFDKTIDFQNNQKSHVLSFLSFPRESYGYNNGKLGFLLSNGIKDNTPPMPPVSHQFQILKKLDIEPSKTPDLGLWPSRQDRDHARMLLDAEWLGNAPTLVGINIAASARWGTKNWPLEYIARLCDLLAADNIRVLITGMDKDKESVRQLLKMTKTKPANFVGKTDILQLAVLIQHCDVYVTPDSAPLHVAAAMSTPFVALFGPTDPHRHLPPAKHFRIVQRDLNCTPCYSPRCRILTHACMKDIPPEEVARHVKDLLGVKAQ